MTICQCPPGNLNLGAAFAIALLQGKEGLKTSADLYPQESSETYVKKRNCLIFFLSSIVLTVALAWPENRHVKLIEHLAEGFSVSDCWVCMAPLRSIASMPIYAAVALNWTILDYVTNQRENDGGNSKCVDEN